MILFWQNDTSHYKFTGGQDVSRETKIIFLVLFCAIVFKKVVFASKMLYVLNTQLDWLNGNAALM